MEISLVAISDDAPSGENLEYEDVFTALELVAQPGEERQAGDEIIAAEEPNYREVGEKAQAVLEQSHDLRAAVHLANAWVRQNGFEGLAAVTTYMRGCLTDYWDTCHPQLDEDDGDPTMRVNAVLGLSATQTVLRGARSAPMTMSQAFGKVTLRMIDIQSGEVEAKDDETILDSNAMSAAYKDTDPDTLQGIFDAVSTAHADVTAINAVFDEKTPGEGPDLNPLLKALKSAEQQIGGHLGVDVEASDEEAEGGDVAGGASGEAPAKKAAAPGEINSQSDVAHSLKKIIQYYEKHEPSSPLPMILERALRLVGADFMTIINDVAPAGVDNVNLVGGIVSDTEY